MFSCPGVVLTHTCMPQSRKNFHGFQFSILNLGLAPTVRLLAAVNSRYSPSGARPRIWSADSDLCFDRRFGLRHQKTTRREPFQDLASFKFRAAFVWQHSLKSGQRRRSGSSDLHLNSGQTTQIYMLTFPEPICNFNWFSFHSLLFSVWFYETELLV